MTLLEITDLTIRYGPAVGVREVNLRVDVGVSAVVGPNGAGKTTLLRGIGGMLGRDKGQITSGQVVFEGTTISGLPPHRIARMGIALVPERDKVFTTLTVDEQLSLAAASVGRERYKTNLAEALELFPNLTKHLRRPAGYLSGGERQMLSIAAALCAGPKLLLIDELSQGLAPGIIESLVSQLRKIVARGIAVLLVEQSTEVAASIADHMYVFDGGAMVAGGETAMLMSQGDIARTYLGMTRAADEESR